MAVRTAAEIFALRATLETYLNVESALASTQADLGMVPSQSAAEIARHATLAALQLDGLQEQTERTGYPIAPLVRQLTTACGEHGRWIHWGATTQDVLNTALALQVNECWVGFGEALLQLINRLSELTEEHRHSLMVARTFGGHALPITFGFKTAVWLSALLRHAERLEGLRKRRMPGEFAGVAGTLASLESRGLDVRRQLMKRLDLPESSITWSAMRDCVIERLAALANLTATLAKITQDVAELSSTEIGEVAEHGSDSSDASSALPYKANPMHCAQASASATLVAQYADAALLAVRQHQERSGEGLLEYQVVPLAFVQTERCIQKTQGVLNGLKVFPARMRSNVGLTGGIILAERYMMALGPHLGRLAAHDLVHEACGEAIALDLDLADALAMNPKVTQYLDHKTIHSLSDPETYLGGVHSMIDSVLADSLAFRASLGQ